MSDVIKKEFKDFIRQLSSEICKQVLFEELNKINLSFKEIYRNYTLNIDKVIEETKNLKSVNNEVNNFIKVISYNNDKVDKALNLVEGKHVEVINKIMSKNDSLFKEYDNKIHTLNKVEKEEFVNLLTLNIQEQSNKYLWELKNILNGSDVKKTYKDVQIILKEVNKINAQVISTKNELLNIEKNLKDCFLEENVSNIALIYNKFTEVDKNFLHINAKAENYHLKSTEEIMELKCKLDKKNNIIIILISILLLICMILLLK